VRDIVVTSFQLDPELTDGDFALPFPEGATVSDEVMGTVYTSGTAQGS